MHFPRQHSYFEIYHIIVTSFERLTIVTCDQIPQNMFNPKPYSKQAVGKMPTDPAQEWERDLVHAINTTNQNIAFLRAQADNAQPSFSDIVPPGKQQFSNKYKQEPVTHTEASNYFEKKAKESFDSSQGVGITRPLPKHVEDDLTMRIGSAIKRSVDRTMQEKLTLLQGHLNQLDSQMNSTEQCEARNRKLISSVVRNLPAFEQNIKNVTTEVNQLKDVIDQLQSDTTANKVWRDMTDANMKHMKQHIIDVSKKFTDKSDVREALELIASNIATTFQSAIVAVKSDVDKQFQFFRSDLLLAEKETRQLTEAVRVLEAKDPAIGREALMGVVERVLFDEFSSMEKRILKNCQTFLAVSNDETKRAMEQLVSEKIQTQSEAALFKEEDSELANKILERVVNKADEKITSAIKGSIETNILEMMETIVTESMDTKMLPTITKELNQQLNSQRWKQGLCDHLLATVDFKWKELATRTQQSVDARITELVTAQLSEQYSQKDLRGNEFEVSMIAKYNTVSQTQEQVLALITESADQHKREINELKKLFVDDLFAIKSKMKVTQSICETLDASLEVVKTLDTKVERLESQNKAMSEKLAKIQELCSSSITGAHEKVDLLRAELKEMIIIQSQESTDVLLDTCLNRFQNIDSMATAVTAVQRDSLILDRQVKGMITHDLKCLETPIDYLQAEKSLFNGIDGVAEKTQQLESELKESTDEEQSESLYVHHVDTSLQVLSEHYSVDAEAIDEGIHSPEVDVDESSLILIQLEQPPPSFLLDSQQPNANAGTMAHTKRGLVSQNEYDVCTENDASASKSVPRGDNINIMIEETLNIPRYMREDFQQLESESKESTDEEQSLSYYVHDVDTSVQVLSEHYSVDAGANDDDTHSREVDVEESSLTLIQLEQPPSSFLLDSQQSNTSTTADDKGGLVSPNDYDACTANDESAGQSVPRGGNINIMIEETLNIPRYMREDFEGSIEKYDYLERVPSIPDHVHLEGCDDSSHVSNSTTEESVVTDDFESESHESSFESESLQSLLK
jgi:hypothetical protein